MKHFALVALACLLCIIGAGCSEKPPPEPCITSLLQFSGRYSLLFPKTVVLQIKNLTIEQTPMIRLHYRNQDSGEAKYYSVGPIEAYSTVNVGILQSGWMIKHNEVVTVMADGYSSIELYFYRDTSGEMVMTHGYAAKKLQQIVDRIHNVFK